MIRTKRVYEPPSSEDRYRVLVDRLWPRGVSKEEADLDRWAKEIAPTSELRELLHAEGDWSGFREGYREELEGNRGALEDLLEDAGDRDLTLLYASRDTDKNNAVVLKEFLEHIEV